MPLISPLIPVPQNGTWSLKRENELALRLIDRCAKIVHVKLRDKLSCVELRHYQLGIEDIVKVVKNRL